jgi:O-antigen/teichoic acid export membrane protein
MARQLSVQRRSVASLFRSLWGSSALRAAAALGVSGLALACGNLMLARVLPTGEFARFALFFAIVQIGINVGPFGADVILTRRHFDPGPHLHRQVMCTSAIAAVVLVAVAKILYPLSNVLLAIMFLAIAAGGVRVVAISHYRSRQRFGAALLLTMSTNMGLLIASGVALAVHADSAVLPAAAMAITLCVAAWLGSQAVAAGRTIGTAPAQQYPMSEAWSAVSFIGAGMVLSSLERLMTPGLLGLSALATLSVLATIAGSPFQMLHQGIGYTLLPSLRNAANRAARRRVVVHEGLVAGATCIAASLVVWWLAPVIVRTVLADRYVIPWQLLLAAILLGYVKVFGSVAAAAVNALGSGRELARLSLAGWFSIATALLAAWFGSRWGLSGLVYGVGLGWLVRAVVASQLARQHVAGVEEAPPSPDAKSAARSAWE